MSFAGEAEWDEAMRQAYELRKAHPAVVAVLARFGEILPGMEGPAERVLVACSLSFNHYRPDEDLDLSPSVLFWGVEAGSWLPMLLTAIETARAVDETERRIMIGAYLIAETFLFHESIR